MIGYFYVRMLVVWTIFLTVGEIDNILVVIEVSYVIEKEHSIVILVIHKQKDIINGKDYLLS